MLLAESCLGGNARGPRLKNVVHLGSLGAPRYPIYPEHRPCWGCARWEISRCAAGRRDEARQNAHDAAGPVHVLHVVFGRVGCDLAQLGNCADRRSMSPGEVNSIPPPVLRPAGAEWC